MAEQNETADATDAVQSDQADRYRYPREVRLGVLRISARADQRTRLATDYPEGAEAVLRALHQVGYLDELPSNLDRLGADGLAAYKRWAVDCQVAEPSPVPDLVSLTRLGERVGFAVVS